MLIDTILGERRNHRRYQLEMPFTFRQTSGKVLLRTGSGSTVDISSGGLLVQSSEPLVRGVMVELSVTWPIRAEGDSPLSLEVLGRVVRADRNVSALRMVRHGLRPDVEAHLAEQASNSHFTCGQ